jgi:hypothetical protein
MEQEPKWGRLMKKARGGKSHATVPLRERIGEERVSPDLIKNEAVDNAPNINKNLL